MPRRRIRQEQERENVERWLVSYADFITLLFAFFVTMYSISRVDQQKFDAVAQSSPSTRTPESGRSDFERKEWKNGASGKKGFKPAACPIS